MEMTSQSDYSEDFEEEDVTSAAAPSSKPSAGSLFIVQTRRRVSGVVGTERRRREEASQPREEKYGTPKRLPAPANQAPTKSKSTGAVRRARVEDAQLSRRVQSFLPQRLQPAKATSSSPARDRQLSAMNHTVRSLQNKLAERSRKMEELSKENRLLIQLQRRQDREWTRIQRQEDELPQLLQRHEQEVRALRKQLRKSHDEVVTSRQRVGELQDETQRLSDTNLKLERVMGKKRLLERDQLTEQVQRLTRELADRDKRIDDLERGLETSGKTHAQEVRGLRLRNRALASETTTLRDTVHKLQHQLKEKTKEMDVLNIYTQRIPRTAAKPLPPSPPPLTATVTHQSSQTTLSCPPFKTVSMQHRSQLRVAASQTDVLPSVRSMDNATQTGSTYLTPEAHNAATTGLITESTNATSAVPVSLTSTTTAVNVKQTAAVSTPFENNEVQHSKPANKTGNSAIVLENANADSEEDVIAKQTPKHTLLQRLRDLDGQKTAPGSSPMTPVQTSGTATTVASTQQPPALSGVTPPVVKRSELQEEADVRERERKQLLLAKLMAIDEGSDPNNTLQSSHEQPPPPVPKLRGNGATNSHGIATNKSSSSSVSSWPEVVENMHQGRPAHVSEDDPFGSRSRLKGGGGGGRGRRPEGVRGERTFITEGLSCGPGSGEEGARDYKPSFGRRAPRPQESANSTTTPSQIDPHLWQPARESAEMSQRLILSPPGRDGPGGLTSQRPKSNAAAAMKSQDVMPGCVISEPDDLEELVL